MAYYLPSERNSASGNSTFPRGDTMPYHHEQNVIIIYDWTYIVYFIAYTYLPAFTDVKLKFIWLYILEREENDKTTDKLSTLIWTFVTSIMVFYTMSQKKLWNNELWSTEPLYFKKLGCILRHFMTQMNWKYHTESSNISMMTTSNDNYIIFKNYTFGGK